jgi:hypothetical protein
MSEPTQGSFLQTFRGITNGDPIDFSQEVVKVAFYEGSPSYQNYVPAQPHNVYAACTDHYGEGIFDQVNTPPSSIVPMIEVISSTPTGNPSIPLGGIHAIGGGAPPTPNIGPGNRPSKIITVDTDDPYDGTSVYLLPDIWVDNVTLVRARPDKDGNLVPAEVTGALVYLESDGRPICFVTFDASYPAANGILNIRWPRGGRPSDHSFPDDIGVLMSATYALAFT